MARIISAAILFAAVARPAAAQTAQDGWSDYPPPPASITGGGGIVATEPDAIYVVFGNSTSFSRYTPSTREWTPLTGTGSLPQPPGIPSPEGAVAHLPGSDFIYLLRAGGWGSFLRYSVSASAWQTLAGGGNLGANVSLAVTTDRVYALLGTAANGFQEFTPPAGPGQTGSWSVGENAPGNRGAGASLVWPDTGGDYLYALKGSSPEVWRYSISGTPGSRWITSATTPSLPAAPKSMGAGSSLVPAAAGWLLCLAGGSSDLFAFSPDAAVWMQLAPPDGAPAPFGAGAGIAYTGNASYVVRGGNNPDFWSYWLPANGFITTLKTHPGAVSNGGRLVAAGDEDSLFALQGGNSQAFRRYTLSTGQWEDRADFPTPAPAVGTCLAFDGGDAIYALRGGTSSFLKYSISQNTWTTMPTPLPNTVGEGANLVLADGALYAIRGKGTASATRELYRYQLSAPVPAWQSLALIGSGTTTGYFGLAASLVYPGQGDSLYALEGYNNYWFWKYSILDNSWTRDLATPQSIAGGTPGTASAMCYPGAGGTILALRGGSTNEVWSYNIAANAWTRKANAPVLFSGGASLAYPGDGGFLYALQGGGSRMLLRYRFENAPPALSAGSIQQVAIDGTGVLPLGGITVASGFLARIMADEPDGETVRVEVEVKPVGVAFDGKNLVSSLAAPSPSSFQVMVGSLPTDTGWHWRIRALDARGEPSAWLSFGTDPDDPQEVDFRTRTNAAPASSSPGQSLPDGRPLPVGQWTGEDRRVRLHAEVTDPDGDDVRIEVEVRRVGVPFSNTPTAAGPVTGQGTTLFLDGEYPPGSYHWQVRFVDLFGSPSPWTSFGGNPESAADFQVLGGSEGRGMGEAFRPRMGCSASPSGAASLPVILAAGVLVPLLLLRLGRRGARPGCAPEAYSLLRNWER